MPRGIHWSSATTGSVRRREAQPPCQVMITGPPMQWSPRTELSHNIDCRRRGNMWIVPRMWDRRPTCTHSKTANGETTINFQVYAVSMSPLHRFPKAVGFTAAVNTRVYLERSGLREVSVLLARKVVCGLIQSLLQILQFLHLQLALPLAPFPQWLSPNCLLCSKFSWWLVEKDSVVQIDFSPVRGWGITRGTLVNEIGCRLSHETNPLCQGFAPFAHDIWVSLQKDFPDYNFEAIAW